MKSKPGNGRQPEEHPAGEDGEDAVEAEIDRELEGTFPASDPPGWMLGVDRDGVYSPDRAANK